MSRGLLIVDNHARFRATARRMFEADGWTVLAEAADGQGALREAARVSPDVVVLDIGLPDGSGINVARELRARHPSVAVVLVSTHDAEGFGELAREAGARGFVSKAELSGESLLAAVTGLA